MWRLALCATFRGGLRDATFLVGPCRVATIAPRLMKRVVGQSLWVGGVGAPAWVEGDDGVATANCTASPFCRVSGGLSITRSEGERPAVTSTVSPKSRPSLIDL